MLLKLYAGKKFFMDLVKWGEIEVLGKNMVFKESEDKFAIPGRKVADEKTVMKWARAQGFTVKKCY